MPGLLRSLRSLLGGLLLLATGSHLHSLSAQTGATRPDEPASDSCRQSTAIDAYAPDCLRSIYSRPISQWPAPHVDADAHWQEMAPLPKPPEPADNPATPEKIALGRKLFEDPRLSRSGQIACASCHDRQLGWGDGRSVSFGHDRQAGRRNAPSAAMAAYLHPLVLGRARGDAGGAGAAPDPGPEGNGVIPAGT